MGNNLSVIPPAIERETPRDVPAVGTPGLNPKYETPKTEDGMSVFEKSKQLAEKDPNLTSTEKYERFRTEMFACMLGEAAYDYGEKLYSQSPNDPNIMAFLTETIWLYEKVKIAQKRSHWIDRMDILQRGIDVSRRCIKEHPDFFPCYRNYVLTALKAADQVFYLRWMRGIGNVAHYEGIMKRGQQALDMKVDFDILMGLAELNARCATWWCSPYRPFGVYYRIPNRNEMFERALYFHQWAYKVDPLNVENACRLAMTLFELGKVNESRRWYSKVRDAMIPQTPHDTFWQSVAHTHLSMRFSKNRWNAQTG